MDYTSDMFDKHQSIAAAFFDIAERFPNLPAYGYQFENNGRRRTIWKKFSEVKSIVAKLAVFLRDLGVSTGSPVAILSNTRGEWMEADLGILSAGGTVVSVYQSLLADDIAYILYDSGAEVVFAENQEQVDKLLDLAARKVNIPGHEDRAGLETKITLKRIIAFELVTPHPSVTQWEEISRSSEIDINCPLIELKHSDLAALVYTSGTTGPPKGVMQTNLNHLANVRQAFECALVNNQSTIFLFLPLAHSFAKLMGYIGLLSQARVIFPTVTDKSRSKSDPQSIVRDIREVSAQIVPLVPRFLEKMRDGLLARATSSKLLALTLKVAQGRYSSIQKNLSPGIADRLLFLLTAPIRRKVLLGLFGPNFRYAVSGGAKLPIDVGKFFDSLGICVLEGYGLTETCVATNVNLVSKNKIGTVGPLLTPDIQLKISDEGEILFRGPNVTTGYLNRPTARAASWDKDGWFLTGDLGKVDREGYLSIIGRKKELIVTSGGKKIPPLEIEGQLKSIPLVSQAVLVGDSRPFCVALLTIDQIALKTWAAKIGFEMNSGWEKDSRLIQTIEHGVEKINAQLASYETIKCFAILAEDFSIENGLLTPSFKVKRNMVENRYQSLIENLYVKAREKP